MFSVAGKPTGEHAPAEPFKEEAKAPLTELPKLRAVPWPWEQQLGEKPDHFRLFCAYRDMVKRNYAELGRLVGLRIDTIKSYAREGKWVARSEAWDLEIDRRVRESQIEEIADMRQRHITTSLRMQEAAGLEIKAHLRKIQEAMKLAQEGAAAHARAAGLDVEEAIKNAFHEPELSMKELISLLDHGTKLERLNRGEPTDRTATTDAKQEAERTKAMLDNLSTEDKKKFLELKRRAAGVDEETEGEEGRPGWAYDPKDTSQNPLADEDTALPPDELSTSRDESPHPDDL